MYACITRETLVFTVFRRVFHLILKLELCRHACRRRDQIIPTCRYGKNMPTTALNITLFISRSCVFDKHYFAPQVVNWLVWSSDTKWFVGIILNFLRLARRVGYCDSCFTGRGSDVVLTVWGAQATNSTVKTLSFWTKKKSGLREA